MQSKFNGWLNSKSQLTPSKVFPIQIQSIQIQKSVKPLAVLLKIYECYSKSKLLTKITSALSRVSFLFTF